VGEGLDAVHFCASRRGILHVGIFKRLDLLVTLCEKPRVLILFEFGQQKKKESILTSLSSNNKDLMAKLDSKDHGNSSEKDSRGVPQDVL
jgi:hypothetical protein